MAAGTSLMLGGDVMPGRLVNGVIRENGVRYPFEMLLPLRRQVRLFFVNLECAITAKTVRFGGAKKAFYFRADPMAIDVLREAGVSLVTLANNHALDADVQGLRDTLTLLDEAGILVAGAGCCLEEANALRVIESDGLRIGVLALCDHQPDFAATETRPGIAYADLADESVHKTLVERATIASGEVDCLVISLHWLSNWVLRVPEYARRLARQLCEAGACIVWGHSPHHILGSEWIGRSIVIYSSGDLLDDYAVDAWFRNDRQLLYEIGLEPHGVRHVRGHAVRLQTGRTEPADAATIEWVRDATARACRAVGSMALPLGDGVEIVPGDVAHG